MRREIPYLSVLAVAAPLAVSAPARHVTEFQIAGGVGSFAVVTRGCEGEVLTKNKVDYENASLEVGHKFPAPIRLGARAGLLQLDGGGGPTRYVNPYASLDWPGFSMGAGWIHRDRPFPDQGGERLDNTASGHIRIGKPKIYFSAAWFEEDPVATAGYATLGLGGAGRKFGLWVGTGISPYDKAGLVTKADYRLTGGLAVGATGRLGGSEGIDESAIALRLSYQWAHGGSPSAPESESRGAPSAGAPGDSAK